MTAAATMKTGASDGRTGDTPSIGTGKASAITAEARSASAPSEADPFGSPVASDHTTTTRKETAPVETAATSGSARRISGETGEPTDQPIQAGRCGRRYLR